MNSITPLGDLVLVEPITEEMRAGLHLPEKMQETNFAFVRAIGPGKTEPIPLQLGDKVMLAPMTMWEDVIVQDKPMRLINRNHILAVMEEAQ